MRIGSVGLIALVFVLASSALFAQVYKVVDEQGRVTYTDSPPKDRQYQQVDLPPINEQPAVRRQRAAATAPPAPAAVDFAVELVQPADGAQVPPGQRNLSIEARALPGLPAGGSFRFLLNGEPVAPASAASAVTIEEIYRGSHQVAVQVLDAENQVVATSPAATVHVHRPSINSPARRSAR